jgi:uncharacterized protein (TIGR00661 family)
MKVLFVVQGEGRGHFTQALSLKNMLERNGHEVVGTLVGKSKSRRLPDFFMNKINAPVHSFESPNFLPSAKNKQANIIISILYNLLRLPVFLKSMYVISKSIKESEADLVINFYELLTGLTYGIFSPKTPYICIAHQYLFLHPDFEFPQENRSELYLLKFFTKMTSLGASRLLALSFRSMPSAQDGKLVVVPPLLRQEVLKMEVSQGDYLHGYMVNSGFSEEVVRWHKEHSEIPLHFFWDKKHVEKETKVDDHLSFHTLDDHLFLHYMAGCKGYATTAGFESVCEAMYLGKPVLMIPTHIEQACNAHDAVLSGAGVVADTFELDKLLVFLLDYQINNSFRNWVKQSEMVFMEEICLENVWIPYYTPAFSFLR